MKSIFALVVTVILSQAVPSFADSAANDPPRIQVAILLDTSNSMDGLIDQARNQLWTMVDELAAAKRNGRQARLEVAVFEYGNDRVSAEAGHVRQLTGLTTELDRVSEALFSLTTSGGSEYCGQAIATTVRQLQWSNASDDLRFIFIAGNEPFTQGPINYTDALSLARSKQIIVNTIFAGDHSEGAATGWQQGAQLAGGNFMSIDHNQRIAHIDAPQDPRLAELNVELNRTYLPFGEQGAEAQARQEAQDQQNAAVSTALLAKRAKAKASAAYKNAQWDLIDALEAGAVELDSLPPSALPAPMADLDTKGREAFVAEQKAKRQRIQEEITQLSKARDEYIATTHREQAADEPTINAALTKAVRDYGESKSYRFE